MARFLLRRVLVIPLATLAVHFLGYSYAHLIRPIRAARNPYLAEINNAPPLFSSYIDYIKQIAEGNFGSIPNPWGIGVIDVFQGVYTSSVASIGLLGLAFALSIFFGVVIGMMSVQVNPLKIRGWLPLLSTMGLSMPSFYLASLFFALWFLMLIWQGPGTIAVLPFTGFGSGKHLVMPTLVLLIRPTIQIAQIVSSLMFEELSKQYILVHRSLGSTWHAIRKRYAFRNIVAPTVITISSTLRILVAELIVVEWLFDWPGLGNLLAKALIPSGIVNTSQRIEGLLFLNPPLIATILSVLALFFLLSDTISAILNRSFDPRWQTEI